MPVQRGYHDSCAIARGLDLVGERWAMLVVRELLLGPKRFTYLRRGLPAASPNALTDRLRELGEIGVVRRRKQRAPAAGWVYELTDWGRELEPVLVTLGTWAIRSSLVDGKGHLGVDSIMLEIRSYFRPRTSAGKPATVEIRLPSDSFGVWLDGTQADARHELPADPDAVIATDAHVLADVLGDPKRAREALDEGTLTITGNHRVAVRLISGVVLPAVAPAQARR